MQDFSWKYEIVVDIQGDEYTDIQYFVVYRMPMSYAASYARICLMLTSPVIMDIKEMLGQNIYPHINVRIFSPFESTTNRRGIVSDKPYRIIGTGNETIFNKPESTIILQLINPVLLKMATTKTFDKRTDEMTGKKTLETLEEHLPKTHGGDFKFHKFCEKYHEYEYDESLVINVNDIYAPSHIIEQRPVAEFMPIYFFDDFNLSHNMSVGDINGLLLDYSTEENFKKAYSIDDFREVAFRLKTERVIPISDDYKELEKIGSLSSRAYIDTKNMVSTPDIKKEGKKFSIKNKHGELQITNKKKIKTSETRIKGTESVGQSTYEMTLPFPDTMEDVAKRITAGYDFLKKGPLNLHYMKSDFGLVDWVHFGQRYALNPDAMDQYVFVPFNIVNIFARQIQDAASRPHGETHPVWLKYYARILFFEYRY